MASRALLAFAILPRFVIIALVSDGIRARERESVRVRECSGLSIVEIAHYRERSKFFLSG
jgi:hypothetical protein